MAEPLNLTCCGKRSLVLIEQGGNWLWQGSESMGLSQNKQRQWRAMVWTEKKDLNEKQKGKGVNWDWWRKESKWGQNVVLGKELKLACEKRRAGREKESRVKRQESWIQ